MNYGFVKVAAVTPEIKVGDVDGNKEVIIENIAKAADSGAEIIVFPELSLTGYTCGDLFFSATLTNAALAALSEIAQRTADIFSLVFIGLPVVSDGLIYNAAACLYNGKILGVVPKTYLPNYNEFYEKRYFAPCPNENSVIEIGGRFVPFGKKILFCDGDLKVAAEICEDLWAVSPPSSEHALAGATVIVNPSCSDEVVGKADYRRKLITLHSARIAAGYVYADSGDGESTTDAVFAGHNVIAENGKLLKESKLFENGIIYSEIDVESVIYERKKLFNYNYKIPEGYMVVNFARGGNAAELTRVYPQTPFVPADTAELYSRAELILSMQAAGLEKRFLHTNAKTLVVGLSGGLDSTLALLVAHRVMKRLGRDTKEITGVTMPCFGTTERTLNNTVKLARALKVNLKKIDITKAVERHLKDIKHPYGVYDAAYENAQARERTQVLMDIANSEGGLVVGTGDLSELALGWATYNGDHMSMYGVNASVPKTLVRYIIAHVAAKSGVKLRAVLQAILDTPVSPELLPAENGEISQKTEEIVGPYILHDFFLYYFVRCGFSPKKILYIAERTFAGDFSRETITEWLKIFVKRFFSQQFKRSCLPDGVKIGTVTLSPRGDWRMPSDAVSFVWLKDLE